MRKAIAQVKPIKQSLAVAAGVFISFAIAGPTTGANIPGAAVDSSADRFLVVDCLLPGTVRKLGGQMTYLAPRRPSRATTSECEIRGGEYVAYDRANYATALQVWMPKAQEGDLQAQTYVGEIFEKGMGQPADPAKAAEWYQKAADKGFQRAMSNLAYLYEKGLGVQQDPVKALNLYRRAAGITDDQLTFVSEVTAVRQEAQSQLDEMSAHLEQQTQEADTLRAQLATSQENLHDRRMALTASRQEANALRKKLAEIHDAGDTQSTERLAQLKQLDSDLKAREARIASQQSEVDELEKASQQRKQQLDAQLAAASVQDLALRKQLGERTVDANSARAELAATQERLTATNQQVAKLTGELNDERARIQSERERLDRDTGVTASKRAEADHLRDMLTEREQQLTRQREQIASLNAQSKQYDAQVIQLKAQQQRQEVSQMQQAQAAAQQAVEIKNVRAELASMKQQYVQTQQKLAEANATLDAERVRVATEQDQLTKRRAMATADQLKEIQHLAQEVSQREARIIEQRAQIAALESDRNELADRIAKIKPDVARVAMRGGAEADAPAPTVTTPLAINIPKGLNAGSFHALIIGNNNYQFMPSLDTAVNDARAVDKVLREHYGFQTRVLVNATRGEILSALNDYRASLKESDNLLIYYAGHGELDAKNLRGYWLPTNARRDDATEWVSDQMITDQIGLMSARHVLVVADSCYSGAMTRSAGVRLITNGGDSGEIKRLITLSRLPSRTVLTSGGEKPVLDGGGGSNSIFARALIDILTRNDHVLEGSALWNQIFDPVKRAAARFNVDQSPRYSTLPDAGHLNGEFLFVPIAS
jgi:hypothetical protein